MKTNMQNAWNQSLNINGTHTKIRMIVIQYERINPQPLAWIKLMSVENIQQYSIDVFGVGWIRYDRIIGQLIFPSHKLVNLIGTTRNSWGNKNMGENKISVAQQRPRLRHDGGGTTVTKWTRAIRVSFY